MHIDILTLFPKMFEGPFTESILKRAVEKGVFSVELHNIRDYSTDKHQKVDDYPFGGGAGMVMSIEPIERGILDLKQQREYDQIIYMTPDAPVWNQAMANELSMSKNLILLCGHYKGVDQRIRDHYITQEISVGDFVLTGGELAAMVVVDSLVRLLPNSIGNVESALTDSFQNNLLSPPVYTRPADYNGMKVPEILLSGHQQKIDNWRTEQALALTQKIRPDLLKED